MLPGDSRMQAQQMRDAHLMSRLADVVIASLLLALTLPLMAVVALAIKLESGGPILERQRRSAPGSSHFQRLIFRTSDPRSDTRKLTRVGQFLWETRIDSLPELINVLRGEMLISDMALWE